VRVARDVLLQSTFHTGNLGNPPVPVKRINEIGRTIRC